MRYVNFEKGCVKLCNKISTIFHCIIFVCYLYLDLFIHYRNSFYQLLMTYLLYYIIYSTYKRLCFFLLIHYPLDISIYNFLNLNILVFCCEITENYRQNLSITCAWDDYYQQEMKQILNVFNWYLSITSM